MKRFAAVLIVASLLLSPAVLQADGPAKTTPTGQSQPDITRFDPGEYVTGPKFKGKHLKGKVIVVEYWGITCAPCLRAIPHTTELAKQYGHEKVVIIANQVWSASERQCKKTWEQHAKNNLVMVTNGGKMPGFNPSSVPAAVIFDHNRKPVWQGHPAGMDKALADAVANLPSQGKALSRPLAE